MRGELAEGAVLPPEPELLQRYGVSRPTLREAMRVLEAEGLITVRRGARGGVRVALPRDEVAARYTGLVLEHARVPLADVFGAMEAMEAPLAGALARAVDDDGLQRLRGALAAEAAAADPVALLAAQNAFHRLVVDLAGGTVLPVLAGVVRRIVDTAADRLVSATGSSAAERAAAHTGSRAHARLVELVAAGDGRGAEALWRRHLSATAAHVLRDLPEDAVLDLLD